MKRGRACRFDLQPDPDPEKLVFIDETGISTEMARLHGRAPRGERCRAPVTAALQTRLQSNRDGLLEDQGLAEKRRTEDRRHLWDAIAEAIDSVTPQEAHDFFSAVGCEPY